MPRQQRTTTQNTNRFKAVLPYVVLVMVVFLCLLFVPAYWTAHQAKSQLISQDYSPEIEELIQTFINTEKASQLAQHNMLITGWKGTGKQFLIENLPQTNYEPKLYFSSRDWHIRPTGFNTIAVDANLQLQYLRLELRRRNMVQWQLQGFCLLDTEQTNERCIFPDRD